MAILGEVVDESHGTFGFLGGRRTLINLRVQQCSTLGVGLLFLFQHILGHGLGGAQDERAVHQVQRLRRDGGIRATAIDRAGIGEIEQLEQVIHVIANHRQVQGTAIALIRGGVLGGVVEDEFVILKRPHITAHFFVEQPGQFQQRITQRLGLQPAQRGTGEQHIVGIPLQRIGRGGRRHLVRGTGENERVQFFDRPAVVHEPTGQPVEQLGVRRLFTL